MACALSRAPRPSSTRSTAPCGVGRTSTWPALALKSSSATKPFTKLGRASTKAASSDSYRQWMGVGAPSSEERDEEAMIGSDMDAPWTVRNGGEIMLNDSLRAPREDA